MYNNNLRYEEELKARYGLLEDDSSEEDDQPPNKKVHSLIKQKCILVLS